MKVSEFNELCVRLGLTGYGASYCGVIDGWPVTVSNIRDRFLQVPVDRRRDRDMAGQIKAELKERGGKLKSWTGDLIAISLPPSRKMEGSEADYIRFCLRLLIRVGLNPPDVCPYCGRGDCDAAGVTRKGYYPTHLACMRAEAGRIRRKASDNQENGSYLTGILGALLGMIVGTIPTLLTIVYVEKEYAVLFALIPICAYFGYRLFRGKMDRVALIVSIVMAILGVFVLYFEAIAAMLIRDYGYEMSEVMEFMPQLLRDPDVWKEGVTGSAMEFLFAGLGVLISWRVISRTDAGEAAGADAVVGMAKPFGPRASENAPEEPDGTAYDGYGSYDEYEETDRYE